MINTTLKTKVLMLGIASVALVGTVALVSLYIMGSEVSGYQELVDDEVRYLSSVENKVSEYKKQIQEWKNVLVRGYNAGDRQKYWSRFEGHQQELQSEIKQLLGSNLVPEAKAKLRLFVDVHAKIYPKYQHAYDVFSQSDGEDYKAADSFVQDLDREPTQLLEQATETLSAHINQNAKRLKDESTTVLKGAAILLIGAMLVVGFGSFVVGRNNISAPMEELIHGVSELAKGNFNFKVDYTSEDELGELADALRSLQEKLKSTTEDISEAMARMGQADDKLERVSISIQAGTQQQSSRTDQMASAMNEMAATSREVAQHTSEASEASNDAEDSANKGDQVMKHAIATMGKMREHISSTTEVIRDLERKTTEVGRVLDVIGGIAEQTNLLALNAAIEAARAGEQGRGFAVVADEVRTLAQKTQESTAEINQIIDSVQNGAQAAVKAIETGREQSDESMRKVNEAGEALSAIRAAVDKIADVNQFIATAAQEQAHVSEDITRNVTDIAEVAEVVAGQANEVLTATENIRDIRIALEGIVGKLRAG